MIIARDDAEEMVRDSAERCGEPERAESVRDLSDDELAEAIAEWTRERVYVV